MGLGGSSAGNAEVVALANLTTSLGQGPFVRNLGDGDVGDEGALEIEPQEVATAVGEKAGLSPWRRIEIGLEQAFDEFRRATQGKPPSTDGPEGDDENELPDPSPPTGPPVSTRRTSEGDRFASVDAAIESLGARHPDGRGINLRERTIPETMIKSRFGPGPRNPKALVMLQVSLFLASARPAGRSHFRRGTYGIRSRPR